MLELTGQLALQWNPDVSWRTLEGTAFVLLDSRMVGLNEVASFIWENFEGGSTIASVLRAVLEEFDADAAAAEADAFEFIGTLVEKEMLVPLTVTPG